jgi:hypothetical protein
VFYKFFSTDEQHAGTVRLLHHLVNLANKDIAVVRYFPDGEKHFTVNGQAHVLLDVFIHLQSCIP